MRYPRERTIFLDILHLNSTSGNASGKGETFGGTKGKTVRETVRIAATRNSDGSWEMLRTREITRQGIAVGAEVISGLRKTFNSFLIAYWPYKYFGTSRPIQLSALLLLDPMLLFSHLVLHCVSTSAPRRPKSRRNLDPLQKKLSPLFIY